MFPDNDDDEDDENIYTIQRRYKCFLKQCGLTMFPSLTYVGRGVNIFFI